MFKVTKIAIQVIENFDELIFSLAVRLLVWGVAVGPALILGFSATDWAIKSGIAEKEARQVGMAIGIAIVAAGAVNAHLAIKNKLAWWLVGGTIGLEIVGLFLTGGEIETANGHKGEFPWFGMVVALIQATLYIGRALIVQGKSGEEKAEAEAEIARTTEDRDWELKKEMEFKKLEEKTRLGLAKIQAERDAKISQNQAKMSENPPEEAKIAGNLPEWLPKQPRNKKEFVALFRDNPEALLDLTAKELFDTIEAIGTERTALNWKKEAINGYKENGHV